MEEKAMEVKAERTEKTEWTFGKKAVEYDDDVNNYTIPHELTVTITLREYRSLLTQAADAKVSKYNSDWCEERAKNKELQEKIDALTKMITKGGENNG